MSKKIRLATVFSGIGAIEEAIKNLNLDYELIFACDNGGLEIDIPKSSYKKKTQDIHLEILENGYKNRLKPNFVKESYIANHEMRNGIWFDDIRLIKGKQFFGKIDLLVGGSPCQSFSMIGKRAGLEDTRGTLFYDYARLIYEAQPKVFIFENVKGILQHDKGNTWKVINEVFDGLGYKIYYKVLNALDFGIPQKRERLFVVGFKEYNINFEFPSPRLELPLLENFLQPNVESKYYLPKKGFEFVTNPKYKNRARLAKTYIHTQKANQQFNWNGDFIFVDENHILENHINNSKIFISSFDGRAGAIRKLTPTECLALMGFKYFKIVVPEVQIYRQSGNSIVVNILEDLVKNILKAVKL